MANMANMANMAPTLKLSEEEINDLLYFARTGDKVEFSGLRESICKRDNNIDLVGLLEGAKDESTGNGALHMAAANGHNDLIQDLCKAFSNPPQNPAALALINSQNTAGNTALHWAALNGHLEAVKVLVDYGADPTITNHRGHDAIYEAELNDKAEVVKWVLAEGGKGLEEGLGEAEEDLPDDEESTSEQDEELQNGVKDINLNS